MLYLIQHRWLLSDALGAILVSTTGGYEMRNMDEASLVAEIRRIQDQYLNGLLTKEEVDGRIRPIIQILSRRCRRYTENG